MDGRRMCQGDLQRGWALKDEGPWPDRPDFIKCDTCGGLVDLRGVLQDEFYVQTCDRIAWSEQEIMLNPEAPSSP